MESPMAAFRLSSRVGLWCLSPLVVISACGRSNSGTLSVQTRPEVVEAAQAKQAAKDASTCLEPAKVLAGVEYICADGRKRKGLFLADKLAECSKDGDVGCVSSSSFPAVEKARAIPGAIKSGVTLAGVAGTLTFHGPANCAADGETGCVVDAATAFRAASTTGLAAKVLTGQSVAGVSGSAALRPADCAADGGTDCVAVTGFVAADTTGLASKVLSGQTVAGVAGNVTLPAASAVRTSATFGASGATSGTLADCALDGATGCVATVGFPAANLTYLSPGNIKKTATIGGVTGDYPSATYPLPGASGTDLPSLSASVAAGAYQFWQKDGTRVTGNVTDAGIITVGTANQTFSTSLYRLFTVPGDANLVAANIASGVNILGVAGSAAMRPADCAADGATGCVVPSSGTIKAADTANFNGWDIRKKRNQTTGAVLTFAGIASQGKSHCRNRAGLWDNTTAPAAAGLDFFDTIDDYNNGTLGVPSQVPAWTMINSTDYGADYACGGIYATGNTATGNTGADATLAHDPNGNWQDLTPGILPGGANSTNTANGCNASDKHCLFKELISGLMVTEVSATTYTWANAIAYCETLGESGHPVTALRSPIPVIGGSTYTDWRLPTQKELMQLYNAGVRDLNQTSNLTTFFGSLQNWFWSSSSVSYNTSTAWYVYLDGGGTNNYVKTDAGRIVCVR
jgi:hypothetical protein